MHHPDAPPPARPQRLFPSAIPSASPDPSHPPSPSHPRKNGWAVYRYSLTHNHRFTQQIDQACPDEAGTAAIFPAKGFSTSTFTLFSILKRMF